MSKMSKLFDQDNMFFTIMGVLFDTQSQAVAAAMACVPVDGGCAGD